MRFGRKKNTEAENARAQEAGEPLFERIAVCGVGLLGGSLGMAARQMKLANHVVGVGRNAERLERAVELGAIDSWSLDLAETAAISDFIALCGPVKNVMEQMPIVIEAAQAGTVITDVGSTKRTIVECALKHQRDGVHFIGSHPMAGSDKSGVLHARADLYRGASVIVTPNLTTTEKALETTRDFWKALGMRVIEMLPARHDRLLALISHLPHLVASVLVETVSIDPAVSIEQAREIAGPGFRDATRIAMGSVPIWTDILTDNHDALTESLDSMIHILETARQNLKTGNESDLIELLERSVETRKEFDQL